MLFLVNVLITRSKQIYWFYHDKICTNQVDHSVEASIHFGWFSPTLWWSGHILEVDISSQLCLKETEFKSIPALVKSLHSGGLSNLEQHQIDQMTCNPPFQFLVLPLSSRYYLNIQAPAFAVIAPYQPHSNRDPNDCCLQEY